MPLDMSIYQNLLRPPKTVAEYDAEAVQGQTNRLALQAGQAKLQDRQRAIDDGNKLRQTVSGFGADQTANYNSLLSSGNLKAAQDYQKANADVTKTGAETAHLAGQTQKDQFGVIVQANGLVGSAASAIMQNPDYNHAVGVIGELKQKLGPELSQKLGLDTLQVPQDPVALKAWANDHYLQSIDTDKQLADARVKSEGEANRSNQVLTTRMTNDTSRANNASTNATTQRGQNMVDARTRESTAATAAAGKVPSGYRAHPDGSLSFIPGGPADPAAGGGKPPTEFQGKSAAFGARAEQADKLISDLTGKYSPAAVNAKQSVEGTPLVGGILGAVTNKYALNDSDQKAEQAQRNFVNALLRQESGAAISQGEFENAKRQYFPQPGDGKEVIAQKDANRKLAIKGFQNSAGKAAFSAPAPAGDIHAQADAILKGSK